MMDLFILARIMRGKFFWILLVVMCFFFLWCSNEEKISFQAIQEKNESNIEVWKEKFDNLSQRLKNVSQKNLKIYFFSPEENSFSWKGFLSWNMVVTGNISAVDFEYQMNYQDKIKNIPLDIQIKAKIMSDTTGYWLYLEQFNFFWGTGNFTNEVMNFFISDFKDQWIQIDDKSTINAWKSFIQKWNVGPWRDLFSLKNHEISEDIDFKWKDGAKIAFEDTSEDLSMLLSNISPLILYEGHYTVNEKKQNHLSFSHKREEIIQEYNLDSDLYLVTLETLLSPKKISLIFKDFIQKTEIQNLEEELHIVGESKNDNNFIFSFLKTLHWEKILEGNLWIKFKNDSKTVFQWTFYDKAKELAQGLSLQVNFEGEIENSIFSWHLELPKDFRFLTDILQS